MARKSRGRASYRSAPARGRYRSGGRKSGSSGRGRSGGGSRRQGLQTLKIVIETAPMSGVARPEGLPQIETRGKKSKF